MFAFSALAFIAGILVARAALRQTIKKLEEALARKEVLVKMRVSQLKTFRRGQWVYKDVWNEVSQGLTLTAPQRELLLTLGALLVELAIPEDAAANLGGMNNQPALMQQRATLDMLVEKINNQKITELWKACSYKSLHEIVGVLVKVAPAANNSDFSALEFDIAQLSPKTA